MTSITLQRAAMLVGAVFVLVGILGFIPGITTNYDDLDFAGTDSRAQLLGLFRVSVLHNLVHLAFGLIGLVLARTWNGARAYLVGGGAIYVVLWIYGLAINLKGDANFIPVDKADNWLHFLLGLGLLGLGLALSRRPAATV